MTTDHPQHLDQAELEKVVSTLRTGADQLGVTPDRLLWHINVTEETDATVALLADGLTDSGLTSVVLIDDRRPPRSGTTPTVELDLNHVSALAAARAATLLGQRTSPFITTDTPTARISPTTVAEAEKHGGVFTTTAGPPLQ